MVKDRKEYFKKYKQRPEYLEQARKYSKRYHKRNRKRILEDLLIKRRLAGIGPPHGKKMTGRKRLKPHSTLLKKPLIKKPLSKKNDKILDKKKGKKTEPWPEFDHTDWLDDWED